MDIDELLDGPSKAPSRSSRFAPKGSKFKPIPKTEPSQPLPTPTTDSVEFVQLSKKEEPDTKPNIKHESRDDAIEMDINAKPLKKVESKEEDMNDLIETEAMEVEAASDEDAVVREIDVYFAPSLDPKTRLYVLQYPLRPLWRPYELDDRCEEVRLKPATAELEVDLTIDVDSKNYDSGADPQIQMKKQTLVSSWKPSPTSGYAVGVLSGNKLHLRPVHAAVQLRPSMRHLDSDGSKRKTVMARNVEATVKAEEVQEGKPSGSSKKLRKISEQDKDSEEVWVPLKYHGSKSNMAAGYMRKIMAVGGSQISFPMSSHDYLHCLVPNTSNESFSSKGPSRRSLLKLPLKERFRTWFLEGPPVHRFDALRHLAPETSVEDVLTLLLEHARLVQGLWVPKSSLVYGTDQGIEVSARDYVLSLFSKNVTISNSQLPQHSQLAKQMKEVLNVLAVERPALGDWKLKDPVDESFVKLYPSLVEKQVEEWECTERKINELLYGGKSGPARKTSSKSTLSSNAGTSKSSNKVSSRTPNVATSKTAMSEEAQEVVKRALQKLFKSVKVCSFQQITQQLRGMAVTETQRKSGFAREAVDAANNIDAFPHEFQAIISQMAVNVHGVCVLKSSPDHPEYDQFRKIVIDLFLAEGPNAKLKRATILEAAKMELKRDIPKNEYDKVLQELGVSQGSLWVLKSGDGNPKR